ncbi:nuclear transport factor 2 family protein [Hyalangium gracile]|uniref:nuclear transport factor 2 family protein n=1 Tax=Hyalangium gracile TaxID=394092 RepID=UPI001CCF18C8|nr:nuclear transport factor 2 family protein [Hyalangium gracile]
MSQETIHLVQKAFELTMKRDMEALRELVTPDYHLWTTYPAHLPFSGEARGPEDSAALMLRLTNAFEILGAEVRGIVTQPDMAVVIVEEKLRSRETGKTTTNNVVSVMTLRDGKLASSRIFADTFAISEVLRQDAPPERASRPKKSPAKKNTVKAGKKAAAPAKKNTVRAAKAPKGAARGKKSTARARA